MEPAATTATSDQAATSSDDGGSSASSLDVTVQLTPAYSDASVNLDATTVTVSIPLVPGEQTTTTPERVVGALSDAGSSKLIGTLTVWSSYDPSANTLTLCSSDLVNEGSMCLRTYVEGSPDETLEQHLTPGLTQAVQRSLRGANQSLVHAAIAQRLTVIVRTPPPPVRTEDWANLRLAYQNGVLKEAYDPEKDYEADVEVYGLESTWYGEIYLDADDYYANVIGSTGDPMVAGQSWLTLWQNQFGTATACSSLDFDGFQCGTYLVGGHVILGTRAMTVPVGADYVFIMPICSGHNANDRVYMAPVVYNMGIALHNYMEPQAVALTASSQQG